MNIQEKTREFFKETIAKYDDLWTLVDHVPQVEKWANKIADNYPEADEEVLILAVWLHDAAYYMGDSDEDHAIKSERLAKEFLNREGLDKEKIEKVAHCVRSHRNKDVAPESIEAKILTVADSASHMTWITYMDMLTRNPVDIVMGKLERDHRDIGLLPEGQEYAGELYECWKKLLDVYSQLNLK